MDEKLITSERIDELLAYLPFLGIPDERLDPEWQGLDSQPNKDGALTMPYPTYPPRVEEFFRLAGQPCWCDEEYDPAAATEMVHSDEALASASLAQIKTMLTFCVRGERFSDGHWGAMVREGRVGAILRQLHQLRREMACIQPPTNDNDIAIMLTRSLGNAQAKWVQFATKVHPHRARSGAWVSALAAEFRSRYSGEPDVCVFTRSDEANRREFGLNELLHDITVARTAVVPSPHHKKDLQYISEALWQVESEFARDGRELLLDFNKLVLGAAQNKLFIAPNVHDPEGLLRMLLAPAKACTGRVYAAMVPHPDRWDETPTNVRVWEFDESQQGWREVQSQSNAQ